MTAETANERRRSLSARREDSESSVHPAAPDLSRPVFGVGAAIQRTDAALEYTIRCEPVAPGGCPGGTTATHARLGTPTTGATWQALMGIDAAMTDRASLLLNVRWIQLGEKAYDDGKGTGFGIDARVRLHRKPRAQSSDAPRNSAMTR